MQRKQRPKLDAQTVFDWGDAEGPHVSHVQKRSKGHWIRVPPKVHLGQFVTADRTLCHIHEVGNLSWEGALKAEKTTDPDKVTCRWCMKVMAGSSLYGYLKAKLLERMGAEPEKEDE